MFETLFAPAIWMPAVAVVAGIIVFIVGNARLKPAIRNAGIGLVALAVAWFAAAYFVQTPVEQAIGRTRAIVAAVEKAEWDKLRTLLDRDTSVEFIRGNTAVTDATQRAADGYGLKNITTLNTATEVVQPGDDILVTINTLLEGAQATTGRFQFAYERRSDGLLLREIRPLEVGGQKMDGIRRILGGR